MIFCFSWLWFPGFVALGWERFMIKAIEMLIVKQLEMLQKIQKLLACFKLLIYGT